MRRKESYYRGVPADCPLSRAQYEIVTARCEGKSTRRIAEARCIAEETVRSHLHHAGMTLGVAGTTAVVVEFIRCGWFGQVAAVEMVKEDFRITPGMRAYLAQFDKYLKSGEKDKRARQGMKIALLGLHNDCGRLAVKEAA